MNTDFQPCIIYYEMNYIIHVLMKYWRVHLSASLMWSCMCLYVFLQRRMLVYIVFTACVYTTCLLMFLPRCVGPHLSTRHVSTCFLLIRVGLHGMHLHGMCLHVFHTRTCYSTLSTQLHTRSRGQTETTWPPSAELNAGKCGCITWLRWRMMRWN